MKSFGMWYQTNEENSNNKPSGKLCALLKHNDSSDSKPKFDLHVNFWSMEDIKTDKNIKNPYLDIGIKISDYKLLKQLTFYCPFKIESNGIKDLSGIVSQKSNANIIFNDDCEIETKDNYTIVQLSNSERLLVFPIFAAIKDVCKVEARKETDGTEIRFDFEKFHNYVSEVEKLRELNTLYIRLRINNVNLRNHIYFDSEPLNKSFESAFSGTRIIDFKVNEKRNIPDSVRTEIIVRKEEWAIFKNIHFLAMMPSSYDLTPLCEERMTCRELEPEIWDDYLDAKIDFTKGHVLAYHWRKKSSDERNFIEDFSCLVKVNYSKTQIITIIAYALSVIALGIISDIIHEFIDIIFNTRSDSIDIRIIKIVIEIITVAVLIFVAIVLGKVKLWKRK